MTEEEMEIENLVQLMKRLTISGDKSDVGCFHKFRRTIAPRSNDRGCEAHSGSICKEWLVTSNKSRTVEFSNNSV